MNEIQTKSHTQALHKVAKVSNQQLPSGNQPPVGGKSVPPAIKAEAVKVTVDNSREAAEALAKDLTDYAKNVDRNLEFRVDDDSGRTVITVRNSETEEVIRQIPSEEALRLSAELGSSKAVLFDQFA